MSAFLTSSVLEDGAVLSLDNASLKLICYSDRPSTEVKYACIHKHDNSLGESWIYQS
ncbi:MAG: hypothetical protein PUP91_39345 [Rhizonema sp. PD37]|nr:hypothetical protein [Rhizonema sp. PD37]